MYFGGVFSTQWGQLSSKDAPITKHGWNVVTNALSRGHNIEEGHYIERWWVDIILSLPSYSSSLLLSSKDHHHQQQQQNLESGQALTKPNKNKC